MTHSTGRVIPIVRTIGGLIMANVMWLAHCLTIVRVLGSTAALYAAVRLLRAGEEPMGWRAFSAVAATYQRRHQRLARFSSASSLSTIVLLSLISHSAGLLSGVLLGWVCVLVVPTIAFALTQPLRPTVATSDAPSEGADWLTSVCAPIVAARPAVAVTATALHLTMYLVCMIAPQGALIIVASVMAALPAYVSSVLFDRRAICVRA